MGLFDKIKEAIKAKQVVCDNLSVAKRMSINNMDIGVQDITYIGKDGKERTVSVLVAHKGR